MDFEQFHSDDDEELASIMPEKKKKDGEKWKKSKGGPLFRNEKKMTYNDIHSPPGVKGKHSVHGVVGPADYIYDQANLPPTEQPPPNTQPPVGLPCSSLEIHPTATIHVNTSARIDVPSHNASLPTMLSQKPIVPPPQAVQPVAPVHHKSQQPPPAAAAVPAHHKHYSNMQHSTQAQFQPSFPPISTMPTKIDRDRPHCSPAVLPHGVPQVSHAGPTPFKHPPQANKQTLLSQAMTVSQQPFQQPAVVQQPPMQVTAANHLAYNRNQPYSQTVSASIPIPAVNPNNVEFSANYSDSSCERVMNSNSSQEYIESPLPENIEVITRGVITSPPASPFGSEVVTEGGWPILEGKITGAPHDYIDGEWANFHPAVPLQDPYDGDNDDNRRKSHGTDSLSESIPESMSSVDSELDESVWKINNEQREYYTKQFKKIQHNIDEVIKGPQARDFFLKSNLPNETLSMIWQLSDMDKDSALNLNEFCIAMHLVVAVKHGVELPMLLPATLIGSFCEETLSSEIPGEIEESDDENKNSSISDDASLSSSIEAHITSNLPNEQCIRKSSELDAEDGRESTFIVDPSLSPIVDRGNSSGSMQVYNTPVKDTSGSQTALARPRASVKKNVNLMDSAPWQLLPPPSSKGKPVVKKNLDLDDDAAFTSTESIEQMNSFSSPEQKDTPDGVERFPYEENDNESDTNDDDRTNYNSEDPSDSRRLSKEKSRSIDSLRLDMNEDYTSMEMRRLSRDSRPRSYSGESHINAAASQQRKEMEIPPIPPPREKGHVRAISLDLNRLMESKSFAGSQDDCPSLRGVIGGSCNLEGSNPSVDSKEKVDEDDCSPPVIVTNRLHSPRDSAGDATKHVVRFKDELDVLNDGGNTTNSMDKKMRKHELQARVRLLQTSNTTLNNLLTQLHMEWKTVSEERIALDILLQKEKQQGLTS